MKRTVYCNYTLFLLPMGFSENIFMTEDNILNLLFLIFLEAKESIAERNQFYMEDVLSM